MFSKYRLFSGKPAAGNSQLMSLPHEILVYINSFLDKELFRVNKHLTGIVIEEKRRSAVQLIYSDLEQLSAVEHIKVLKSLNDYLYLFALKSNTPAERYNCIQQVITILTALLWKMNQHTSVRWQLLRGDRKEWHRTRRGSYHETVNIYSPITEQDVSVCKNSDLTQMEDPRHFIITELTKLCESIRLQNGWRMGVFEFFANSASTTLMKVIANAKLVIDKPLPEKENGNPKAAVPAG